MSVEDKSNTFDMRWVLKPGLYVLEWVGGGRSLAAVGQMTDGELWYAPANWLGHDINPIGAEKLPVAVATRDWSGVKRAYAIESNMLRQFINEGYP